jgi:hypothetical protein
MTQLAAIGRICLPRKSDYAGLARTWRRDLVAGFTVGIAALPLAHLGARISDTGEHVGRRALALRDSGTGSVHS